MAWFARHHARNARESEKDALFVSSDRGYVDRSLLRWHRSERSEKAHGVFRREARGEGTHRILCCRFDVLPLTDARRADGGTVSLIAAVALRTALRASQ